METFLYLCTRIRECVTNMQPLKQLFQVIYSEEADAFLTSQSVKVKAKILYNIMRSSYSNDPELFKKLENTDIWEFRTRFEGKQYRMLAFWDKRNNQNTLVVATHGFIKKTQKTPKQEITHAEQIKDQYFNAK
ncbi:MAG: type II toxin-antitoxin system RelE/ParE family toxin [Paludibacteraceae bacterium]|nr:type II toxin-antitoxin system RelE/ParE family toxin [Paludibacteraceae bacterium]